MRTDKQYGIVNLDSHVMAACKMQKKTQLLSFKVKMMTPSFDVRKNERAWTSLRTTTIYLISRSHSGNDSKSKLSTSIPRLIDLFQGLVL